MNGLGFTGLGLGDYDSSSDESEKETQEKKESDSIISIPSNPSSQINAFDGYASDSDIDETPQNAQSDESSQIVPPADPEQLSPTQPVSPKSPVLNKKRKRHVSFPPSPNTKPDPELQAKVQRWAKSIRSGDIPVFSERIQKWRGFLNPYLLTQTCEDFRIDEYSTNFSNFSRKLKSVQQDRFSYISLRERQNRQIEKHHQRELDNDEIRNAKRARVGSVGDSRYFSRTFSNSSYPGTR